MSLLLKIKKNIPLSTLTTFKVGGLADEFFEVETKKDLLDIFKLISKNNWSYFVLGGGSNLVFNDAGYRGIILKINYKRISFSDNYIIVGAGTSLTKLINSAKKRKLGGLEWAYGIPATVGGAVVNNAGAFESSMANLIDSVTFFDFGKQKFKTIPNKDCNFDYRTSVFKQNKNLIIWEIKFILKNREISLIENLIKKYFNYRKENQPLEYPSAGSFFKNISTATLEKKLRDKLVNDFIEHEIVRKNIIGQKNIEEFTKKTLLKKTLPAGYILELLTLKEKSIGGAQVSKKHANFIINKNQSTAEDIIILASLIKQKARQKLGIQLFEEVEYVGF